jgi:hypothetical protein
MCDVFSTFFGAKLCRNFRGQRLKASVSRRRRRRRRDAEAEAEKQKQKQKQKQKAEATNAEKAETTPLSFS